MIEELLISLTARQHRQYPFKTQPRSYSNMSSCDPTLRGSIKPSFMVSARAADNAAISQTLSTLNLQPHPEGGYFVETDRDPFEVPNPFMHLSDLVRGEDNSKRNASTTIFYYLTPNSPQGNFHRNSGRTVHTLHRGRGRYVLIHADKAKPGGKAEIETFVVGHDIAKGERLQWVVAGGKYKASFLLPDDESSEHSDGLLISEVVVPGFDYRDHDFLEGKRLDELVTPEQMEELRWLIRDEGK